MSFIIALVGYSALAIVSILDKFILSNEKVEPVVFVFYSTIYLLPLNIGLFFLTNFPSPAIRIISAFSALMFVLGLWTMYRSLQKSEISHVGPLIGGLIPLAVLILSRIFLNEEIFLAT